MESAMLIIAMVSGIMQGVQTWLSLKDRKAAKEAQTKAYVSTLESGEIRNRAERLMAIVPTETLDRLRKRLKKCYDRFDEMLDNEEDYFPQDLTDAAEKALPSCVCRTLKMIEDVNGSLPDDKLEEAWETYSCIQRMVSV
jgi:hypothetical protein